ncbi:cation:proton antiporter [Novosphingobium sp. ZN18A2]|uniref:cation:proton antiporter domain-containing protein n=1 Tax=Novosphingobium sp. ZN18A2 TaxID=3079861 RepID=UPI0030CDE06A
MHTQLPFLREIILFLAAAGLVMPIVRRLKISPVLGFLCIGLLIGPYGLGQLEEQVPAIGHFVVSDLQGIQTIGELGVTFLLFSIGLEMSVAQLWGMRRTVFGLGSAQILFGALAIGLAASVLGTDTKTAILFGLCLALSSTAIVVQLLSEQLRLASNAGRTAFGILLMQDLAVVPILLYVGVLGSRIEGSFWSAIVLSIGEALLTVAAIFLIGRLVVRPVLRFAGSSGSREMFMAAVLLFILGTSALTAEAGLSMALGAFLAGLLFSGTEYRHQVNSDIEPFKGLLLALFFISVGMRIDLMEIWNDLGAIALAAIALIVGKAVILVILARAFGHPWSVATEVGILLGEGGEFALVAVSAASSVGAIAIDMSQFLISVVVLTMLVTPGLAWLGRITGNAIAVTENETQNAAPEDVASDTIVIGGFGRVGRIIGKILEGQRIRYVAIDSDPILVASEKGRGLPIYYGDASNPELLRHIGISKAAAFITTMDQRNAAEHIVSAVHRSWPHIPIYARARDPAHARKMKQFGAYDAIPETTEASLQLSESLLFGLGIPDDVARSIIDQVRDDLCFDPPVRKIEEEGDHTGEQRSAPSQ